MGIQFNNHDLYNLYTQYNKQNINSDPSEPTYKNFGNGGLHAQGGQSWQENHFLADSRLFLNSHGIDNLWVLDHVTDNSTLHGRLFDTERTTLVANNTRPGTYASISSYQGRGNTLMGIVSSNNTEPIRFNSYQDTTYKPGTIDERQTILKGSTNNDVFYLEDTEVFADGGKGNDNFDVREYSTGRLKGGAGNDTIDLIDYKTDISFIIEDDGETISRGPTTYHDFITWDDLALNAQGEITVKGKNNKNLILSKDIEKIATGNLGVYSYANLVNAIKQRHDIEDKLDIQ